MLDFTCTVCTCTFHPCTVVLDFFVLAFSYAPLGQCSRTRVQQLKKFVKITTFFWIFKKSRKRKKRTHILRDQPAGRHPFRLVIQATSFDGVYLLVTFLCIALICKNCFLLWLIKYPSIYCSGRRKLAGLVQCIAVVKTVRLPLITAHVA